MKPGAPTAPPIVPRVGSRAVLGVVFLATVIMALSSSMLTIALPAIADDLGASAGQASWVLAGYQVSNVALIILMGQLSDSLDSRVMFLAGVALFTVTSGALALASSAGVIIGLRVLQGAAAAALLCTCAVMLAAVFRGRALAKAMGFYLAGFSLGQVAGPGVGGLVTDQWGWRWLFLGAVPLCLVTLLWGSRVLTGVPRTGTRRFRVDLPGNAVLTVVIAAVIGALTLSADHGWGSVLVLGPLAGGVLLLPVLWWCVRRARDPAIDPELLRIPGFRWGMTAGFLVATPRLALMAIASLYFQGLEGDTPLAAATRVTLVAVGLTVGSLLAEPLTRRWSERVVSMGSATVSLGALLVLVAVIEDAGVWLDASLLLVGFGTGAFQTLNVAQLLHTVPLARAGSANAVRVMLQSLSLSVALSVAVSLVVTWAAPEAAQAFISGRPADLSPGDVADLITGYRVALGVFAGLVLLGLVAILRTPQRGSAAVPGVGT